jgi:polar amino acid transport system substrate-binding protein
MKLLILLIGAALLASNSMAGGLLQKVVLCHEEEDSYPWILKERQGLDLLLLDMMGKELNIQFQMKPLPWVRCLHELKNNHVDGAFKLSFSLDRLALGRYPMRGAKANRAQRLHSDSYSLYRLKGSSIDWDGERLTHLNGGVVGAQTGFTIISQLKELGAMIDDQTRSAEVNFKKLLAGRVVAVALHTKEGDMELGLKPDFSRGIERIVPPLIKKDYYLVLSNGFYENNTQLSQKIWAVLAKTRESTEFKKTTRQFMQDN